MEAPPSFSRIVLLDEDDVVDFVDVGDVENVVNEDTRDISIFFNSSSRPSPNSPP